MTGLLATAMAVAGIGAAPPPARAADGFTLTTAAAYAVRPDDRRVDVTVEATFTNATPNPAGQFSVFDEIQLAVQDGASELAATDADGALDAALATADGVTVATIGLRDDLRYEDAVDVTVTYRLADGAATGLRVRPSAVIFPAWAFGSSGTVSVDVPVGYEASVDGDALTASSGSSGVTLTSGSIDDPTHWLALVIATSETGFATINRSIPLDGGTVDLQVRAFDDDPEWGTATTNLLTEALPLVQAALGLEYTRQGPVVVTEAVDIGPGSDVGEGVGSTSPELVVAFDQSPFAIVHEAAHLWITDQVARDRWIREGLASWAAGVVASELQIDPPYDPAARRSDLDADAFPLESWGAGSVTPEQEAYGYAASWALVDDVVAAVRPEGLQSALRRIVAGRSAYDPVADEEPDPGAVPVRPVDSRRFLDHVEAVSDADLAQAFADRVFAPDIAGELAARTNARDAYRAMLDQAGDWGPPRTVTSPLAAWDFPAAADATAAASAWLEDRDALTTAIGAAGLTAPGRLRDRYVEFGGGTEAVTELAAERAVVEAYQHALDTSARPRDLVTRIGLLAGQDPNAILMRASGAFADGDLDGALASTSRAQSLLDDAQTAGLVRLASAVLLLLIGLGLVIWLIRRRGAAGT